MQFLFYCAWLILFSCFCEMSKTLDEPQNNVVVLIIAGSIGVASIYLLYIELLKAISLTLSRYLTLVNAAQLLAIILPIAAIELRILFDVNKVIDSCVSAVALFVSWLNLFQYLRGFTEVAWITYALKRIGLQMKYFTLVLFLVVLTFSLTL